jgi:hypothetical protein
MSNKTWLPDTPSPRLSDRVVGIGNPVYITGEIGINTTATWPMPSP